MNAWEAKRQAKLPEWKSKVAECCGSGLEVRTWCKRNHVSPSTYYKWKHVVLGAMEQKLPGQAVKALPQFAEVPTAAQKCREAIVLEYEGFHLELPDAVNKKTLQDILSALKSC